MKEDAQKTAPPVGARPRMARLEKDIRAELGTVSAAVAPLLDEVRAGVHALYPEAGGTRLAPQEHEERQGALLGALDELEDVLEALQLAVRSGRPGPAAVSGKE